MRTFYAQSPQTFVFKMLGMLGSFFSMYMLCWTLHRGSMDYVTYFSLSYHFHFLVYGFCDPLGFLPMCYKLQLNFEFGPLKTCYDEYVGEVFGGNAS
jgi:hypothetical protein